MNKSNDCHRLPAAEKQVFQSIKHYTNRQTLFKQLTSTRRVRVRTRRQRGCSSLPCLPKVDKLRVQTDEQRMRHILRLWLNWNCTRQTTLRKAVQKLESKPCKMLQLETRQRMCCCSNSIQLVKNKLSEPCVWLHKRSISPLSHDCHAFHTILWYLRNCSFC